MANINVRHSKGGEGQMAPTGFFAPMRNFSQLLRWDPFAEMFPSGSEEERMMFVPDFDVKENTHSFVFKADLPGMDPKDVDVKITGNRLTVSGKREEEKEEKGDTMYRRERSYGSFQRSFTLPTGVDADKLNAELKNGVLTLTMPKKPEAMPKQVNVKSG